MQIICCGSILVAEWFLQRDLGDTYARGQKQELACIGVPGPPEHSGQAVVQAVCCSAGVLEVADHVCHGLLVNRVLHSGRMSCQSELLLLICAKGSTLLVLLMEQL